MSQSIQELLMTAVTFHQQGKLQEAERHYRQILALQPEHADVLHMLGVIFHQTGRSHEAVGLIERAIANNVNMPEAFYNLALALQGCKDWDRSIAACRCAIEMNPNIPQFHDTLGTLLLKSGNKKEAIAEYRHAILLLPTYAEAHNNLSSALRDMGNAEEAIAAARRSIELRPNNPEAHNSLGNALSLAGDHDSAITEYQKALSYSPGHYQALRNLATAYIAKWRLDDAIPLLDRLRAVAPQDPFVQYIGGIAACLKGRYDDAIIAFRQAIAGEPNHTSSHNFLGMLLLTLGNFRDGWEEYEWRLKPANTIAQPENPEEKKWDGKPLNGRTLLIVTEQGFGDAIQFVRYLPMLEKFGGKVILESRPELTRLLGMVASMVPSVKGGEVLPEFDVYYPLLSLPKLFETDLTNIPNQTPYLKADEKDVAAWAKRMGDGNELKVGLVWAGSPTHVNDRNRSISLADFGPLAEVPGVRFFSLQKGHGSSQAPPAGMSWTNWTAELKDFADTAALISNLDLVIAVDTGIVHLAGALAKPVWTLIPKVPDWRWMLDREDTPWYPTMRLFRQKTTGDWASVIAHVRDELAAIKPG